MRVNTRLLKSKIVLKGFNNTTLADNMNVSRSTITNVLNETTKPSYEVMQKFTDSLELTSMEASEIFFSKKLA